MKHLTKKSKTKQEYLDNDVIAEKRKNYFNTGHGVGADTPGGETGNSVSEIIGRGSIMGNLSDHNKD